MGPEVRMGQLTADFGRTAADYGKHRAGFPPELSDRLAEMDIARIRARSPLLKTLPSTWL